MPATHGPLCSGASSSSSVSDVTTAWSITVASAKRAPPCTMRCPTASMAPSPYASRNRASSSRTALEWSRRCSAPSVWFSPTSTDHVALGDDTLRTAPRAHTVSGSWSATRASTSTTCSFTDELPQLRTSTFTPDTLPWPAALVDQLVVARRRAVPVLLHHPSAHQMLAHDALRPVHVHAR